LPVRIAPTLDGAVGGEKGGPSTPATPFLSRIAVTSVPRGGEATGSLRLLVATRTGDGLAVLRPSRGLLNFPVERKFIYPHSLANLTTKQ
jgi:hypothetical protein